MRSLLILVIILSANEVYSQDEYILGDFNEIKVGDTRYLLFDKVNLRSLPGTDTKVVEKLSIGSNVKIQSKEEEDTLKLNGITDYWYQVVLLDDAGKETNTKGYLWGGFFAEDMFETKNDPGVKFYYGLEKVKHEDWGKFVSFENVMPEQWGKVPVFQLRAVLDGREISKLSFEGIGVVGMVPGGSLIGNKGLRNVSEIFRFTISDHYCGGYFGDIYVFWDKANLHFAKKLREGFDAPVFKIEELIFPNDKGGIPGTVIFYEAAGESDDDGKNIYEYQRKTKLTWTGCEFKTVN